MKIKKLCAGIMAIATTSVLLFTACQTDNTAGSTTATTSSKPSATAQVLVEGKEAVYTQKTVSLEGTEYHVFEYTPATAAKYSYGGTNLALSKPASSSGNYKGMIESGAVDGNTQTIWASSAEVLDAWFQVDLGSAKTIGRVEIVARPEGGSDGHRTSLEILASNDPTFKTYDTINVLGSIPFEKAGTYIANCDLTGQYRYVRLHRTYKTGHFTVAELRVFDTQAALINDNKVEEAPDGAQMIIARSGKALTAYNDYAVLESYDFANTQRWSLEEANGGYLIKNITKNKYLTYDKALVLADKTGADNQTWVFEDLGANWKRITNKSGGVLTLVDGYLAVASKSSESVYEMWDISDAYIENLKKGDTKWMVESGYGVMYHLLPDSSNVRSMDNDVDVEGIVNQLKEAGAGYFLLAVGQNSGFFNTPNAKFDSIISKLKGKRTTQKDFPLEFYNKLNENGMKLMLYTTTLPPDGRQSDTQDFYTSKGYHTRDSAMLWSFVYREWSERYGDKVWGWWVDGGYCTVVQDEGIFTILANGMKSGNPDTCIAFNPGIVVMPHAGTDEYTAGETDYPFGSDDLTKITDQKNWLLPSTWPIKDKQWFELTFLSYGWCHNPTPRKSIYDGELWAEYVSKVLKEGGAICLDVDFEPKNDYLMNQDMVKILKAVKEKYNAEHKSN